MLGRTSTPSAGTDAAGAAAARGAMPLQCAPGSAMTQSQTVMDDRPLTTEDGLLLGSALLLPWAFGGVEIWAYRIAAFLIVLAGSLALVRRGPAGWGLDSSARWLAPAFLLAAWAGLQIVPLPPAVVRLASPVAYDVRVNALTSGPPERVLSRLEEEALERVPEVAGVPAPPDLATAPPPPPAAVCGDGWWPLSVEPTASAERLFWYFALLVGFLVVRDRASDGARRGLYLGALFAGFVALAAFGVVQDQTWNGKLFWVRPIRVEGFAFGPFVNSNHFAGLMELAVPAMAGYAWSRGRSVGRRLALRDARFVLAGAGAAVCFMAALLAASKMATLLMAVGLATLAVSSVRTARARIVMAGAIVVAGAALAGLLAETRLAERVETYLVRSHGSYFASGRLAAWQAAIDMNRDYPVAGSGFGTFREVFVSYMPAGGHARWAQAHNDYLELLLEGGPVALALVLWLAFGYARRVRLRSSGSSRRALSPLRLGLAVGIASLAVHALVDFNHQIPANAWTFVMICALAAHRPPARDVGADP